MSPHTPGVRRNREFPSAAWRTRATTTTDMRLQAWPVMRGRDSTQIAARESGSQQKPLLFSGNSPHGPTVKTAATRREFRPPKTGARLWAAPVCGLAVKHEPLGITWPALRGSYESFGHVVFVAEQGCDALSAVLQDKIRYRKNVVLIPVLTYSSSAFILGESIILVD